MQASGAAALRQGGVNGSLFRNSLPPLPCGDVRHPQPGGEPSHAEEGQRVPCRAAVSWGVGTDAPHCHLLGCKPLPWAMHGSPSAWLLCRCRWYSYGSIGLWRCCRQGQAHHLTGRGQGTSSSRWGCRAKNVKDTSEYPSSPSSTKAPGSEETSRAYHTPNQSHRAKQKPSLALPRRHCKQHKRQVVLTPESLKKKIPGKGC